MAFDFLAPVANTALQSVTKITIETAYLPKIEIPNPFAPGPPNPWLQRLKPKVTLESTVFSPMVMKPYGEPGPTKWPLIQWSAIIGAGVMVFVLWKLISRR